MGGFRECRRNRYYDPAAGRFTQEDPIGLAGGLNLYGYADGDPVNFSDPFGLCPPIDQCSDEQRFAILAGVGERVAFLQKAVDALEGAWEKYGDRVITAIAMTRGGGRGGFNSRTVARTSSGRTTARVDVELPGTHGPGNVHVQTKGPGGNQKYPITDPKDLSGLPRSLRDDQTIIKGIEKAFDMLKRWEP